MASYKKKKGLQAFKDQSGFYTTPQRSKIMSKIRGKDTKPEKLLRQGLWRRGFRYRIHARFLPGRPDIAFIKEKVAIFIDGEFWHGYEWEVRKNKLKTNREYWIPKIERNMERDRKNNLALEQAGWTVLRFWSKKVAQETEQCIEEVAFHLGYYPV